MKLKKILSYVWLTIVFGAISFFAIENNFVKQLLAIFAAWVVILTTIYSLVEVITG